MYHWIRDCAVFKTHATYGQGYGESMYIIYHFLRVAGWSWIWECDGIVDNHCTDASMEASGVTDWTVVGSAVRAKDTSQKHMGAQSLRIASEATDSGVRSAALLSMSASTNYRLAFWAYNNTGQAWDVQVDTGTGSFVSVGTIPSDGAWTLHDFGFTTNSSGTAYFQILDTNGTHDIIYVDSVVLRESWFEYRGVIAEDLSGSPDGQLLNGNEFHTASYTFTAGDIGRYICVWDPTNIGNSGVYRINAAPAIDAVLDLRAGGTPALTPQTGLRWRLVDATEAPGVSNNLPTTETHSGWGLQSPHSEKWRFFMRASSVSGNSNIWLTTWSAPYDVDFNVENGNFDDTALSTHQYSPVYSKSGQFTGRNFSNYGWYNQATFQRLYLQTDDDGSYLYMVMRGGDGVTALNSEGTLAVGFTGADSYHTLRESFVHFGKRGTDIALTRSMYWGDDNYDRRVPYNGIQVISEDRIQMARCVWMHLGYGNSTAGNKHQYNNARSNPFGDVLMLYRPRLAKDFYGTETFMPTEKVVTDWGIWESIPYINDWVGVDSNQYFHLALGVFMEMPSSGGVGLFEPLT